jgi:hypothetical protein
MSRTPDFVLKAMNKATGSKTGKVGAAWQNEDGSISLVLDLPIMPSPDMVYTLFTNDEEYFVKKARAKKIEALAEVVAPTPGVTRHRIKK